MNHKITIAFNWLPIILIACFLVSPARAEWWQGEQAREKLSLTEDQVKEMDRIFTAHQKTRVDRQAEMQKIQLDLNALLARETVDEKKAEQGMSDFCRARDQMFKEMLAMKLAVRKVLTPEQVKLILSAEPDTFSVGNTWASKKSRLRQVYRKGNVVVKEGEEQ